MMKKAQLTNTYPHLALLSLRNTPVTGLQYSPAQLLMGRVLRNTLPSYSTIPQPAVPQDAHSALQRLLDKQWLNHNKGTKRLPVLRLDSAVHMETTHDWCPAVVTIQREEPRSSDTLWTEV